MRKILHFGLAEFEGTIDRISVEWPATGITQVIENITSNQLVTLVEPGAADWNHDGHVDELDYAIWSVNHGTTAAAHTDGDSDNDGDVDGLDFLTWQRQDGEEASTTITAVPRAFSHVVDSSCHVVCGFRGISEFAESSVNVTEVCELCTFARLHAEGFFQSGI